MYIYIYIYIYIRCLIILKRGQFSRGANHHRLTLRYRGEKILIKKGFHLARKENIKKTKEVLRKPGKL